MVKLFESEVENINSLPLVDAYLELQVNNLALVDVHLRDLESQMARGYRIDDNATTTSDDARFSAQPAVGLRFV